MTDRNRTPVATDSGDVLGIGRDDSGQGFALGATVRSKAWARPEAAPAAVPLVEAAEPDSPQRIALPLVAPVAWDAPEPTAVALPTDERFADQFYLLNSAAGERDLHLFAGPDGTAVWEEYTGAGVRVGIIDDGIDYNHPDLDDNYDALLETVDGFHPHANDAHGTAVAGIIAAENNGAGVVGVAYDASITMMAAISDAPNITTAASFGNAVNFDVVNNSWGYTLPWFDQPFNTLLSADYDAFDAISLNGRGGLGTVFVKSAGNGRAAGTAADNANFSGLNSNHASVTVAAVNRDGFVSSYSTEGACLLVSAFGTPLAGQVVSTDRLGAAGYDPGDYTSTFNGTSSAAPMVTGVVALMLDANPTLGYRDVSEILALTARHTGSAIGSGPAGNEAYAWEWNHATRWNGQGLHFSEDYGFGLVDALAAVRLAESWTQSSTRANLVTQAATSSSLAAPVAIPDNNATGVTVTFTMAAGVSVEQMQLDLGLSHTFTGDLLATLTSPSGTVSQLLDRNGGSADIPNNGVVDVSLASNMFRGEDSGGTWTLKIADVAAADVGTLSQATLWAIGRNSTDDIYVMTEEASEYAIPSTITDGNGGTDTLNASAVFSASLIHLGGGVSVIDGRSITVADIENAIGGDGNDSMFGSGGANVFNGFRGDDLLSGNAGDDVLSGEAGRDSLVGGAGDDLLVGGPGTDAAYFNGAVNVNLFAGTANGATDGSDTLIGIDAIGGSAGDDTLVAGGLPTAVALFGNGGADFVHGGDGGDTLLGGDGDDNLQGNAGNDLVFGDAGFDFAYFAGTVTVDLALGTAVGATDGSDQLFDIEGIGGSAEGDVLSAAGVAFAAFLSGNGGADSITGGDAGDTFFGGAGNDTLAGAAGDDVLHGGDDFDYAAFGSAVTVSLAAGTASGEGADQMDGIEGIVGSAFGDVLDARGVATEVHLLGGDGADALFGGDGSDRLDGGEGNDTLTGRVDDTVFGGGGDDLIVNPFFSGGVFDGGDGNDTLDLSQDPDGDTGIYDLSAESFTTSFGGAYSGFENMIGTILGEDIIGTAGANLLDGHLGDDLLAGGAGNDTLRGGAGNDSLDGGTGNDSMTGGSGNDRYIVDASGDVTTETSTLASEIDTVVSSVSRTLGANLERLTLSGSAAMGGTGNALANTLTGNAGANSLIGLSGNDRLVGNAGNDTLDGGTGNDTMTGGLGNDRYIVDSTSDVTTETSTLASEIDTVISRVSRTLGANLEHLTLAGSAAIDGTGNALANTLTGNAGANRLLGLSGNDRLVGNAGSDRLDGGTGSDTMTGGLGNDRYIVDSTGDVTTETSTLAGEIDTVVSSVSRTLGTNLEMLTLTGSAAINGTGNTLANTITGNAGANTLYGGAGNDLLDGGLGNDSLVGGTGADIFRFASALGATTNVDRMAGFVAVDDAIQLENAVFVGIGAAGALAAGAFRAGAAAGDANDRVIYDAATGRLFFDADGTGAAAQILFATVVAGTAITAADIFVT